MAASILRDKGLSSLVAGDLEIVATGFQFTEGPLWHPDGSLWFQDIKAERSYRVREGGQAEVVREATGAANGQTFDARGGIIFCEQNGRRVSRMDRDGSNVATVIETFGGRRLNSPNDVVSRSDGRVFFTDPPYGVPSPEAKELPYNAVFGIDPDGTQPVVLIDDFEKPNGLAFSPDERTLYICDTARYHVRAFEVTDQGHLRKETGRVFATMDPGEKGGPDGMKVDRDGRVYVAVALGVWVYAADGTLLGIISTPKRPSNLAWCGAEGTSWP